MSKKKKKEKIASWFSEEKMWLLKRKEQKKYFANNKAQLKLENLIFIEMLLCKFLGLRSLMQL